MSNSVRVRTLGAAVAILDMPAAGVASVENEIVTSLWQITVQPPPILILNLSAIECPHSRDVASVMVIATVAEAQGLRLLAAYGPAVHAQAFAVTHLTQIPVYGSEAAALTAVAAASTPWPPPRCDNQAWAMPVSRLEGARTPPGAINLNVNGREVLGPMQGFGRLLRKSYSIRLDGVAVAPEDVVTAWKQDFASFWPKGNGYYGPPGPMTVGDVAVLNLTLLPGLTLSTGARVVYADATSFCFMACQGHMFGGLINFGAYDEQGTTVVRVEPLIRAGDPLYELMLRFGIGESMEDRFWRQTLQNLARHFGVQTTAQQTSQVPDPRVKWQYVGNIRYNAAVRTTLYTLAAPIRWLAERVKRGHT